jgi:DnaJ like chaperone protein
VRFVPDAVPDPYAVLGVSPDMALDDIRRAWKKLVRENHPDALTARGLPDEAIKLAERRLNDINDAWSEISKGKAA